MEGEVGRRMGGGGIDRSGFSLNGLKLVTSRGLSFTPSYIPHMLGRHVWCVCVYVCMCFVCDFIIMFVLGVHDNII